LDGGCREGGLTAIIIGIVDVSGLQLVT